MRFFTPGTASATPSAPVGFGAAAGRPPKVAHVPIAIVARASPQTSRAMSMAARPPIVQYAPFSPVGIEPSTMTMYLPLLSLIAFARFSSARLPAAAMIVSW
jgi:hypothetical protein